MNLHVVWLHLAKACGSVLHFALEFFHITNINARYSKFHMCFSTKGFRMGWQQLGFGIAMGCTISPVMFVTAFEVIHVGTRQVARGLKLPTSTRCGVISSLSSNRYCGH